MRLSDTKLLILIPCRGTLQEGLVKWLWHALPKAPFLVEWDTFHGRPVDDARNGMVQRFLSDPARPTHLMMIDDDILPPPNALDMLNHQKPVVSAVLYTWTEGAPMPLIMKYDEEGDAFKQDVDAIGRLNKGERLVKVVTTGTGCFVAQREVYENLVTNWFRYEYNEAGRLIGGEDFAFFRKVSDLGYSVWIDGKVICGHVGSVDIAEVARLLVGGKNENSKGNDKKASH